MEIIKTKLERITDFWNDFVWDYKAIQGCIVWNDDVKTNYYGDILSYYNDTFDILTTKPTEEGFQKSIFYATGLLQVIYVHQDLTDEILNIFKINNSLKKDKDPNREIRNELIGHPINKDSKTKELLSSIFLGKELSVNNIHYVKYSKDNDFSGVEKSFSVGEIINSHKIFLNKYFDLILEKIKKISSGYVVKLKELENVISRNDFELIVGLTSKFFEYIFTTNYLYEEKILIECYQRKDEHIRYTLVIENFKQDLLQMLSDKQIQLNEICSEVKLKPIIEFKNKRPKIEIKFVSRDEMNSGNTFAQRDYHYEIQKLFNKHPIWDIAFFKREFSDDPEILDELNNMENNFYSTLEYYSSFYHVKALIKEKIKQASH